MTLKSIKRMKQETALETLSSDRARELSERLLADGSEVTLLEFLTQLLARETNNQRNAL